MKRKLRKELRELKKGRINKEDYEIKRRKYKEWYEAQKKKHKEAKEEKIRNSRSEKETWKYINKYRKKKSEGPNKDIQIDSWRDHFMEILEGTRERTTLRLEKVTKTKRK